MKIVLLGGNFNNSGGTERVASLIANELSSLEHDVVVASVGGGDLPFFPLSQDIKVRTLFKTVGRGLFRAPLLILRIRNLLINEKPDALIVVESMLTLFTVPANIRLPTKHICWEHFNFKNDNGRKVRRIARQLAACYCNVVVTLTEKDRDYWLSNTCCKANIVAIPNLSPFAVQHAHTPLENSQVVLAVGRLVPVKGFDILLKAWKTVSPKAPEWRLRIVGDGSERDALKRQAIDLGIEQTVDFIPASAAIDQHYRQAAIYCLSSRFEGFPMVLVEAISFGLPVVSFDCDTGPAEVLDCTESILVPPGDITGLSNALIELILNPEERKRLSVLSKIKASEYQPEKIMHRWLDVLN